MTKELSSIFPATLSTGDHLNEVLSFDRKLTSRF